MLTLESVSAFLEAHALLAYVVLFLGAYFETLIGIGFFVHGEFFFLPGSALAGAGLLNVWLVTAAFFAGGILGDSSSYIIGRRYGDRFFRKDAWVLNLKNYARGRSFFEKHGARAVFFARFLGPISWVTPFFAGVYKLPYRTFLPYNILGVVGGIGQFIVVGYFFGSNYEAVLALLKQHWPYVALAVIAAAGLYYYLKKK
ncbi:hypothetical protein A2704_00915 [Candidatus Kaiserbacteria bacterium RIFCSPHIGHO2_01_FULL_54_36b]|uniref:VTT domain-containing protein n=1 Tax=Candidatus Kaiserbacteria bacterium RIFCSPHIGHO2_01_FULL_54_36b TaxID=1798483 RepID=A0A1F6CKA8_9BACT|nr:MAG: hypothetical protein A2704_00915 [Candidatus Kaiserbacteria bacterium RIFCSPHIGHO2_01_FULL_54_36b]